jgi:prevent-host-death family protein
MFAFTPDYSNEYNVGAFDAKTFFSEFLRKVQDGAVINISKNGKKVAVLKGVNKVLNEDALNAHNRILNRKKSYTSLSVTEIKELKNAGRKY